MQCIHAARPRLDAGGYIVVNKDLSVPGAPRVFALGDAAATGDIKQGYVAATQVKLVAANIAAAVAGKPGKPLKNSPTDVRRSASPHASSRFILFLLPF